MLQAFSLMGMVIFIRLQALHNRAFQPDGYGHIHQAESDVAGFQPDGCGNIHQAESLTQQSHGQRPWL